RTMAIITAPPTGVALTAEQRRALLRPISPPGLPTLIGLVIFLALAVWAVSGAEISPQKLQRFWPNIFRFVGSLWPPDNAFWFEMLEPILATVQIALLGTLLSVVLSFPFGLIAAR